MTQFHNPEHLLSVDDVYKVVQEHLSALDKQWPDNEPPGSGNTPNKVHVVELIEGIKLKLSMLAEKNMTRHESAFDRAARKITGGHHLPTTPDPVKPPELNQKTAMQLAHEAAQARMKRSGAT